MDTYRGIMALTRWTDLTSDPNDQTVISWRQNDIDRALQAPVGNRLDVILPIVENRRVLDLGCVDHLDEALLDSSLHGQIRRVAAETIAADRNEAGLDRLASRGELTLIVDLEDETSWRHEIGQVDVVIAGELIEHLESPAALLRFSESVVRPHGTLVVTTPNPFAPHRIRAGWRQASWENVDHLSWQFPGGMLELGQRHGWDVVAIVPAGANADFTVRGAVSSWRLGWRRRTSLAVRQRRRLSAFFKNHELPLSAALGAWLLAGRRPACTGETLVYVLRRVV